jgi:N-methylhydantoinase B/oxoprolinase/acetone carboxylase alpha subunit
MSIGDLNAGVAAGRIAVQRLAEILARYGVTVLLDTFEAVLDHGETLARKALATVPPGVYEAEDVIDGDGVCDDPIPIRVRVTVSADKLVADFTGCAAQTRGPINCARGALMSACKTVFKAITAPQSPSNEGLFRPFELIAPEGTVFTAVRPAPTGWYYEASAYATELVWKALASVLPDRLSAGSYLSLCAYYIGGTRANGDYWVLATPQDGGWGACADRDGESSLIATTDGDTYNYPAEVIETAFPLTLLRNAFNVEAGGGAGRFRGGLGTIREYRVENEGGRRCWQVSAGRYMRLGASRAASTAPRTTLKSCAQTASAYVVAGSPVFLSIEATSFASLRAMAAVGENRATATVRSWSETMTMASSRPKPRTQSTEWSPGREGVAPPRRGRHRRHLHRCHRAR